jgi:hypothetical protein
MNSELIDDLFYVLKEQILCRIGTTFYHEPLLLGTVRELHLSSEYGDNKVTVDVNLPTATVKVIHLDRLKYVEIGNHSGTNWVSVGLFRDTQRVREGDALVVEKQEALTKLTEELVDLQNKQREARQELLAKYSLTNLEKEKNAKS